VEFGEFGKILKRAREISKAISHYVERFKAAKASHFVREGIDSIALNIKAAKTGELGERRRDIGDIIIGDRENFEVRKLGDF